ncbi:MAG: RNA polymerase sigma factor [Colwellia sp.]|nr:RNA polymerase sigma factor [Colwellia sp.]
MIKKGFGQVLSEIDFIALKKGKHYGFNAAYKLYADHVYSLCFHIVGNEQVSSDLLQAVFETLLNKSSKLQGAETFGPWLKKCSVNACMNYFRQTKRDNIFFNSPLHVVNNSAEQQYARDESSDVTVNSALEQLSSTSRSVVYLHTVKDLKHSEIAPNLGIEESNSRQLYRRALKQMRSCLKKQGENNE